jgi:hypothetical protein
MTSPPCRNWSTNNLVLVYWTNLLLWVLLKGICATCATRTTRTTCAHHTRQTRTTRATRAPHATTRGFIFIFWGFGVWFSGFENAAHTRPRPLDNVPSMGESARLTHLFSPKKFTRRITRATRTTLGLHAIYGCIRKVDMPILVAFKASKKLFWDLTVYDMYSG